MKKLTLLYFLLCWGVFNLSAQACQNALSSIDISTGRNAVGQAIAPGQVDANWTITAAHSNNIPNYIGSPGFYYYNAAWLPSAAGTAWLSWYPLGYPSGNISSNWIVPLPPTPLQQIPTTGTNTYQMEFPFCVCDLNNDPNAFYQVDLTIDANFLADNVAKIEIWEVNGTPQVSFPSIELDLTSTTNFSNYFFNSPQTGNAFLTPGDYVVRVYAGTNGNHVGVNFTGTLTSPQNVLLPKRNAACSTNATIAGYKYGDTNGNGVQDQGEIGLPSWTIDICDINNPNIPIASATTDFLGYYYIPNLSPGTYIVKEDLGSQNGWTPTNPISGQYTVNVQVGDVLQLDFLNYQCQINSVSITSGPLTFCANDLTHNYCATAMPQPGLYNYQWILNGQILGTGQCRSVTWPSSGGTLQVVASQLFFPNCTDTTQITPNILPTPSACISPGQTDLCVSSSETYNPCQGSFLTTYTWTVTPDACSGLPPYQSTGGTINVNWPPSGGTICLEASQTINGVICSETQCVTVPPCCNMQLTIDSKDLCSKACIGNATVNISGGVPPYTINWSTGAITTTVNNLCPGTYSVTVTDAGCCTQVQSFTITNQFFMMGGISHTFDANYPMTTGRRVYLFDIDGDGFLDLVTTGDGIRIRLGLGTGQFSNTVHSFLTGNTIESLDYGNMNNDPTPDLVCLEWQEIHVLVNTSIPGLPSFTITTTPTIAGGYLGGLDLHDFNGGGDDVVIVNGLTDRVYIYSNTNNILTLTNTLIAPPAISYWEVKIEDIDGLNGPDIVFGVAGGSNTVHAFLDQGGGTFANGTASERSYNTSGGLWPRGLHFADMDGVGGNDMIVSMELSDEIMVNLTVNNTSPNWQRYPTGGKPIGIDIADLDNDGDPDVMVAVHFPTSFIRVFNNDGTGNLSSFVDHATPTRNLEVISGDLQCNCCIDFVTVNQGSLNSSVFLNECHDHVFQVTGFVFCENNCTVGAPYVGASVQIVNQTTNAIYTVVTDVNGMYTLTLPGNPVAFNISLPAGNYATACGSGPVLNFTPNNNSVPDILVEDTCGISVNLIGGFAVDTINGSCPYTVTPCEGLLWDYCVEFRNEGCNDIAVSSFELTLPANVIITQNIPDLTDCNTTNVIPGWAIGNTPANVVSWTPPANFMMPAGDCYSACVQVQFTSGFSLPVTTTAAANYICTDGVLDTTIDGVAYNDTCSCDPNYKLVFPLGCGDLGVIGNEELTYTVHFANIGQSPAFDIVVEDQLDANLDWSTFQWVGSSHTITANNIDANGLLTVEFIGISLPPNTGGWFKYKIHPLANVPDMTTITNNANIFFDSNPPVATNTVSNLIILDALDVEIIPVCPVVYLGYTPQECVDLEAIPSGGLVPYSYLWNTGATTVSITVCPTTTTSYGVTITDKSGCTAIAKVEVKVIDVRCGRKGQKVNVCHIDKLGNSSQLCLQEQDVAVHLAHGDKLGNCDDPDPCAGSSRRRSPNDPFSDLECRIFPNPNDGSFMILLEFESLLESAVEMEIYNSVGQLIDQRVMIMQGTTFTFPVELKEQPSGVYFIRLKTSKGEIMERVIVN